MRRRDAVRTIAMAAGSLGFGVRGRAEGRLERIGIQLYTVRDLLRDDFEGTLAALRGIGFDEVEFAGYPPGASAKEVRAMLDRVGLAGPSAHLRYDEVLDGWPRALDFAADVGHRYVVLASVPANRRSRLDDYRRLAELLDRRGEDAARRGLGVAYHNHAFELEPLDGRIPFDVLLEHTDPALVEVELDLYWTVRGGADPLGYFARWPGRFPMVHVKDMARDGDGFTELGRGRIDFPSILPRAGAAGTRHYFYEQDRTDGPPLASARASFQYLAGLRFGPR